MTETNTEDWISYMTDAMVESLIVRYETIQYYSHLPDISGSDGVWALS